VTNTWLATTPWHGFACTLLSYTLLIQTLLVTRQLAGCEVSELCGWCGSRPMSDASIVVVLCVGVLGDGGFA
jgi:hypothetical protein